MLLFLFFFRKQVLTVNENCLHYCFLEKMRKYHQSAELAQKVVTVKFGKIHLNEVCVGEFLQLLGSSFTCSYMNKQTNTMLYILTFHA